MKNTDIHTPKIKTGFTIPENYFDTFEKKLFTKIIPDKKAKMIPFYQKKSVWMSSIAAVFVLGFMLTIFYKQNTTQLTTDELTNYIVDYQNFTTTDIVQYLDESDLEDLEITTTETDLATEEYLLENQNLEHYID